MEGDVCRSRLVCREIMKGKIRDEQLRPQDVFSPMPRSEGLKMLVSTLMRGRNDDGHAVGPVEMENVGCVASSLVRRCPQVDLRLLRGGQTLSEHVWNARCSINLE